MQQRKAEQLRRRRRQLGRLHLRHQSLQQLCGENLPAVTETTPGSAQRHRRPASTRGATNQLMVLRDASEGWNVHEEHVAVRRQRKPQRMVAALAVALVTLSVRDRLRSEQQKKAPR